MTFGEHLWAQSADRCLDSRDFLNFEETYFPFDAESLWVFSLSLVKPSDFFKADIHGEK